MLPLAPQNCGHAAVLHSITGYQAELGAAAVAYDSSMQKVALAGLGASLCSCIRAY
jgi:hypothetical protein